MVFHNENTCFNKTAYQYIDNFDGKKTTTCINSERVSMITIKVIRFDLLE